MRLSTNPFRCVLLSVVVVGHCHWPLELGADELKPITGRQLFERTWRMHDELCPKGDGLGPCFNAESCVACHQQGGVGGSGSRDSNVDLLTLVSTQDEVRKAANGPRKTPLIVHPSFLANQATIVLHRFGTYSDYESYRFQMLGSDYSREMSAVKRAQFWASVAKDERTGSTVEHISIQGLRFQRTQRNTPSLFGLGLIDAIPAEKIQEIAKQQESHAGEVSGRVAPAKRSLRDPFADPDELRPDLDGVGRFGWRGQIATLADFVLGACSNELGLHTVTHPQPINPLDPGRRNSGEDLDVESCKKLVEFVRKLPRPVERRPLVLHELRSVEHGERLFQRIGCSDCHMETVAGVERLYSDLLLHDLGKDLADPVPAMPQTVVVGKSHVQFGYSGGVIDLLAEIPSETRQEWRTPPLWGIADSAPYLHDGRAPNLHQAITLHGGEASGSKDRYVNLASKEKESVLNFLGTFRAPGGLFKSADEGARRNPIRID